MEAGEGARSSQVVGFSSTFLIHGFPAAPRPPEGAACRTRIRRGAIATSLHCWASRLAPRGLAVSVRELGPTSEGEGFGDRSAATRQELARGVRS